MEQKSDLSCLRAASKEPKQPPQEAWPKQPADRPHGVLTSSASHDTAIMPRPPPRAPDPFEVEGWLEER